MDGRSSLYTANQKMIQYRNRNLSILHLLIIISFFVMMFKAASFETHTVGDDDGWDQEVDFAAWSRKYHFQVGDFLLFKYKKGEHNVFEVTEQAYRNCDVGDGDGGGVLGKYESGNDAVELTEARAYWFICDIQGHCLGGMRIGVHVQVPAPNSTTLTPPTSSSALPHHPFQIMIITRTLFLFLSTILFRIF